MKSLLIFDESTEVCKCQLVYLIYFWDRPDLIYFLSNTSR